MNILAIGAHPDDIEYGCGGTLTKYTKKHAVYLYVATKGEAGGDPAAREREQEKSAEIMGARDVFWGGYQDTEVPLSQDLIHNIERVIEKIEPDLIFIHYRDDTHQDHRNLSDCALSATRYVPNLLFYEVPTTQNFSPTVFVDIESIMEQKMALLKAHASQITKTNIKDLTILEGARSNANFRGIQGRVKFAEAFCSQRFFLQI